MEFPGNPKLETDRLILRKLDITDTEDVYEYAKNSEVTQYVLWETHQSIEDSHEFINWTLERIKKDKVGDWGIQLKETNKIIGTIGFSEFNVQHLCGSIGYTLSKDYWGQGITTEALKMIIRYAFERMNVNRIEAVHFIGNEASGRVMEKAGMQFEGVIRQKVFAKGTFWDVKQYGIVKADYNRK